MNESLESTEPAGSPEPPPNSPVPVVSSRLSLRSRARLAFLSQVCWTIVCIVLGMSESYPWLSWARLLAPLLNWALVPAAIGFPLLVFRLSVRGGFSDARTLFAFVLSVVLSLATFFAIIPLIC